MSAIRSWNSPTAFFRSGFQIKILCAVFMITCMLRTLFYLAPGFNNPIVLYWRTQIMRFLQQYTSVLCN